MSVILSRYNNTNTYKDYPSDSNIGVNKSGEILGVAVKSNHLALKAASASALMSNSRMSLFMFFMERI